MVKINIADLFSGKRGIIFGVPGPFTPTCSKGHLPGYVAGYDKFKQKGIDVIACVAAIDVYVVTAWGKQNKANGKIRMLADPTCAFTKEIGMEFHSPEIFGGFRSKRYAIPACWIHAKFLYFLVSC
jgi:2-Cys peroxiredoxin 5